MSPAPSASRTSYAIENERMPPYKPQLRITALRNGMGMSEGGLFRRLLHYLTCAHRRFKKWIRDYPAICIHTAEITSPLPRPAGYFSFAKLLRVHAFPRDCPLRMPALAELARHALRMNSQTARQSKSKNFLYIARKPYPYFCAQRRKKYFSIQRSLPKPACRRPFPTACPEYAGCNFPRP